MEMKSLTVLFLLLGTILPSHSKQLQLRKNDISPSSTTTKRIGLSVGTIPGVANCARDGAATSDYEIFGEHNAITPAGEHVTRFYIYLDYSKVGDDEAEIGEAEVKTSLPTECSARIHGEHHVGGSVSSQGTAPRELDVVYDCRKDTKVDVMLTIPVVGHAPVVLQWTKACDRKELEDLDVSFVKSLPLPSLNNGSMVVSAGKVSEMWENASNVFSGRALELEFELSSRRTIPSDSVFRTVSDIKVSADPPNVIPTTYLLFKDETISLPNPNITSLLDSAADQGQETILCHVHLECLAEGTTEVVLKIRTRTPFDPYRNTVFRFQHTCSGPHPRLLVSSQRHVMSKESNVFDEDADVARSGTLRPRWDDPEDIAMIIDEQQETVPFFYALKSYKELASDRTPLRMMVSNILLSNNAATCDLDSTLIDNAVSTEWHSFSIRCMCHSFESSKTLVSVSLRPLGYAAVDIRYIKKCGGHKYGANIRVMGSEVQVKDDGDLPEWIDVVRNGVTTSLWQRNFTKNSADVDSSSTTFTVMLGVPSISSIDENGNKTSKQRVGPVEVSVSKPDVLRVSLLGSLVMHPQNNWLDIDKPYGLHVKYECKEKGKWVLVEIKIPLLEPTFEPLVFSYYYHCETFLESIGL